MVMVMVIATARAVLVDAAGGTCRPSCVAGVPAHSGSLLWVLLGAALLASALAPRPGHAQGSNWRVSPRVSLTETWSDNIALDSSGTKQDDWVTALTPGVGVAGTGRRLKVFFDYQAQGLHYANGSNDNTLNHQLQSNATAEVLSDSLFVDVNAVAGQRNTSTAGRQARDNLSVSANREAFFTYGVSPYYRQRFGPYADAEFRLRLDEVNSDGGEDASLPSLSARIDSGREFALLPWSFTASEQRSESSDGDSTTYRRLDLSVRRNFTRRYGLRLSAGYEDNDLGSRAAFDNTASGSGVTWRVTGIWTPTGRTNFELGYGRRVFGDSVSFSARHQMRRAVFTASYSEEVTTGNINQSRLQLFAVEDAFGNPIENPGASADRTLRRDQLDATNDTTIQRRFNFGLAFQGRRTSANVSAFHDRREGQSGQGDETVIGINASATRQLSWRTSASVGSSWQVSDAGAIAGADDDQTISLDLRLNRQFNSDLSGSLGYTLYHETSESEGDFTENRVTASLRMLF